MTYIDSFLNRITMYRLVLYVLSLLALVSILFGFTGVISYSGLSLVGSLALLVTAAWVSDFALATFSGRPMNVESAYITGFILFFTLAPFASLNDAVVLCLAAALAVLSKYVLEIRGKHLFNPVGIALLIVSLAGSGAAIWWVAAPPLIPFTLVLGLLIIRKIRRFDAFAPFVIASVAVTALLALTQGSGLQSALTSLALSWPLLFLGAVMLTEPQTMPRSRGTRLIYGTLVGALFVSKFHLGPVFATPQFALIAGNVYAYLVSSKQKVTLRFKSRQSLSNSLTEYVFEQSEKLAFVAGQYLEWTLPHPHPDSYGTRRYFTIASSPSEDVLRLGVGANRNLSTFKKALLEMKEGDTLTAGSLEGDFVLPEDKAQPLVFIAGGVGITPFASMIRFLSAQKEKRDIVLFYAANTEADFAYKEVFAEAERSIGLAVVYVPRERITEEMIRKIPQFASRVFYISGPHGMVEAYENMLRAMSVPSAQIKTDYFPGY